jgi:non-ribosomal peptide synthetase component E (peptide arylation enzyme)
VCAVADADLGERVCACVVPLAGEGPPTLEALREHLAARGLARFKLPEQLEVLEALPRNPLGKVVRGDLQAQVQERIQARTG